MFLRLSARATFVADTKFVSGTQKCFWFLNGPFAYLCKTAAWDVQVLGFMENVNRKRLIFEEFVWTSLKIFPQVLI